MIYNVYVQSQNEKEELWLVHADEITLFGGIATALAHFTTCPLNKIENVRIEIIYTKGKKL